MGVVYQARQMGMMERPVVIKVINRALLDNPDALERFRREVEAAAKLSHPEHRHRLRRRARPASCTCW